MKKLIQLTSLAIFALSVLVSCAQETNITEPSNSQENVQATKYNEWSVLPGQLALKMIDLGDHDQVWGLNPNGYVVKWNGNGWTYTGGLQSCISVSGDGNDVWGLQKNSGYPEKWNGTNWTVMPGAISLSYITVGNNGQVWGLNPNGYVVKWNGNGWAYTGGLQSCITVSPDGLDVYGIQKGTGYPEKWNGTNWTPMNNPIKLTHISAGNRRIIWGLNENGYDVKYEEKGGWVFKGGLQKCVSTNSDGTVVWGLQKVSGYAEKFNQLISD